MKNLLTYWKKSKNKTLTGILIISLFISTQLFAADFTVSSADQFNSLSLSPGDVVTWTNGTYSSKQRINFTAKGTASNPIILKAETPGGVIFIGETTMNISGDYIIIDGFYWNGGAGTNNHVQFRKGSIYANHSIIRNCAFNNLTPSGTDKHRWIVLYGTNNVVENCSFLNKNSPGALVLVELEYNDFNPVGHQIRNNYFYNYVKRDPSTTHAGDSETIRVGTSEFQDKSASVTVEGNYFLKADGENEIITNKSANNVYRNNTFRRCRGSLVLRHGARATVEGNFFLGENVEGTGGVRISDSFHTITNNYIQNVISTNDKWNNPITLVGGSATSGGTSNGYQKVDDIVVAFNTIYNSDSPIFYNNRSSYDPRGVLAYNAIYTTRSNIVTGDISGTGQGMQYAGNIAGGSTIGISNSGITNANANFSVSGEIFKPSGSGPAANAAGSTYSATVNTDIEGRTRPNSNMDIGAHEISGGIGSVLYTPFTNNDVGDTVGACFLNATGGSLSSCTNNPPADTLSVATVSNFSTAGESKSANIISNINWTVTDNSTWISVTPTSGSNNGTISITTSENTATNNRTGTVTVNGDALTRTITITQSGVAPTISVSGVLLSPNTATIAIGENQQMAATVSPSNATNQNVSYTSSNTSVVTVSSSGLIAGIGKGNATITVTTADGGFTDTSAITVTTPTTETNLALNKTVTGTGTPDGSNIPSNLVDGSTSSRWSVKGFPKSFTVDLGAVFSINSTELVCYRDRAYQYVIESATTSNGTYTQIVDRSSNTTSGTVSIPITDNFSATNARYVRVTVSGASGYSGSWVSLMEFRVFGSTSSNPDPTPNCTAGTNLATSGNITSFSNQQTANPASNIIDDNTGNRWSAQGFPQNTVIDLGDVYTVNEINLYPYNNRAYQFRVEGSSSSATSGFSTLTDATNNTSGGSVINRNFSSQSVRYIKLTITGASGYSGSWSSIKEFKIICAGNQNRSAGIENKETTNIRIYPNPFTTNLTVQLSKNDSEIIRGQLVDIYGREVSSVSRPKSENNIHFLTNLPQGVYFLRLLNADHKVIKTTKVISGLR